jgi:anti-sigma factor RsiW
VTEPCLVFEDDLAAFRAGALPEPTQRERAAHLAGCPACARALAADEALDGELAGEPVVDDGRLAARIEALGATPSSRTPLPWRWAACLAVGAALAALVDLRSSPRPAAPPVTPWRLEHAPLDPDEQPGGGAADPRERPRGSWELKSEDPL